MPFMIEDFVKGQKAGFEMDLLPLQAEADKERIQAERERIPLETEKMQQNLQTSRLSQQKEILQIQALVEAQKDDASAKTLIGDLAKDPTFKDLPIPEQMLKIGQGLAATGKFKQAEEFYSRGERAKLQEAQTQKANFDIQQNKLDRAQSYLTMLNDDGSNVNEVMMAARTDGALTESELKILSQRGQEALNAGTFKAFKTDALKNINSIRGKAEVNKEIKNKQEKDAADKKYELDMKRYELLISRAGANSTSKDERGKKDVNLALYKDAGLNLERVQDDLRDVQSRLAALPAAPKPGIFFDSEDPNSEARKEYTARIQVLKEREKEYSKIKEFSSKQLTGDGVVLPSTTPDRPLDAPNVFAPDTSTGTAKPVETKKEPIRPGSTVQTALPAPPSGEFNSLNVKPGNFYVGKDGVITYIYKSTDPETLPAGSEEPGLRALSSSNKSLDKNTILIIETLNRAGEVYDKQNFDYRIKDDGTIQKKPRQK